LFVCFYDYFHQIISLSVSCQCAGFFAVSDNCGQVHLFNSSFELAKTLFPLEGTKFPSTIASFCPFQSEKAKTDILAVGFQNGIILLLDTLSGNVLFKYDTYSEFLFLI